MSIGGFDPSTNQFRSSAKYGGVLFESAARTTAQTGETMYNPGAVGLRVRGNVSAITASPGVTFKIQEYNPATETWSDVLASAARTATGAFDLTISPAVADSANVSLEREAPAIWRVVTTVADADSATYKVTYEYLVSQLAPPA